jgi:hypothetical protein
MSTERNDLLSTNGVNNSVSVTSFFGGTERQRCLQLTQCVSENVPTNGHFQFVQLDRGQALALARDILRWANES